MKHYEVVCAIIYNKDGKIFCTQRGPGRALEGKWEFPGGKVEKHETYEETIVREIKEELNSTILPLEFIGLSNYEYHNLIDVLSKKYEVYSLDLLGYGLSDKPNMTYTNYLYVELLTDFIKNIIHI